jgi:hypothetical protein
MSSQCPQETWWNGDDGNDGYDVSGDTSGDTVGIDFLCHRRFSHGHFTFHKINFSRIFDAFLYFAFLSGRLL